MLVVSTETVLIVLLAGSLFISVTCQQSDNSSSSSWAKLEIAPNTLGSMPYGNFRIDIYEDASNHKPTTSLENYQYYFAPIALLNHKSANSSFNNVTKRPEMRFYIEMWNDRVQDQVTEWLKGRLSGHQVKNNQVSVIPLENVILTSTSFSSSFSLPSEWKPIRHHQHVRFTLTCTSQDDCHQLANEMRFNPEHFDHLKLRFSLSSQDSKTKETVIRIKNSISGNMTTKLLQKFNADREEIYLTADDEKQMLSEMATNIQVYTSDDSDVVSHDDIYTMLTDLLVTSRNVIKDTSNKMWESVFWNNDNYRPDKSTKMLNEIYQNLDEEDQKKLVDSYLHTNKFAANTEVKLPSLKVAASADSDFSRQGSNLTEELSKLHTESRDHVEWDGEKFVPKPMVLGRINLAKFLDTQSFHNRNVKVRYTTALLSTPINFVQHADLTVTDEWQRLDSKVKELERKLNERTRPIENTGKIPTSCSDLKKIGHFKSGLYSVMGTKTVETVYCNFFGTDEEMQKWIGYDDIKSMATYFHVQRNTPFSIKNIPIPFHIEKLNVGNAMDLKSGKFTAPRAGMYYFSFTGVVQFSKSSTLLQFGISLYLNGHKIGMGWVEKSNAISFQSSPLSVHATSRMKKDDHVWVQIWAISTGASLFECCDYHFTHFMGWVLEEDIVE